MTSIFIIHFAACVSQKHPVVFIFSSTEARALKIEELKKNIWEDFIFPSECHFLHFVKYLKQIGPVGSGCD